MKLVSKWKKKCKCPAQVSLKKLLVQSFTNRIFVFFLHSSHITGNVTGCAVFGKSKKKSDTGVSCRVGHAGSMQNSGRGLLPGVIRH